VGLSGWKSKFLRGAGELGAEVVPPRCLRALVAAGVEFGGGERSEGDGDGGGTPRRAADCRDSHEVDENRYGRPYLSRSNCNSISCKTLQHAQDNQLTYNPKVLHT
jgi:hypothetical protein